MVIKKPFKASLHCPCWEQQLYRNRSVTPAGKIIWSIAWAMDDSFERHFTRIHHLQNQKANVKQHKQNRRLFFYKELLKLHPPCSQHPAFLELTKVCLMKVSYVVTMLKTCSINNSSTGWKLLTQAQCEVNTKCIYIFSDKIPEVTEIKVKELHSQDTPQSLHASSSCWLPTSLILCCWNFKFF